MIIGDRNTNSYSKRIVNVALLSALLVASKLALAYAIANIEVVTTLVISFSFVYSFDAFFAVIIFCALDIILYPPSIDVIISYFIYWPLMSLSTIFLKRLKINSEIVYFVLALVFTISFGFLTSFMFYLFYEVNFWAYYFNGIIFYVTHLISTLVFMFLSFKPLTKTLLKINKNQLSLR